LPCELIPRLVSAPDVRASRGRFLSRARVGDFFGLHCCRMSPRMATILPVGISPPSVVGESCIASNDCAVCPSFLCTCCGNHRPWCVGASDDRSDWCDDCFAADVIHRARRRLKKGGCACTRCKQPIGLPCVTKERRGTAVRYVKPHAERVRAALELADQAVAKSRPKAAR
jgi:hypothetical protein